jgi:hypothetical protein
MYQKGEEEDCDIAERPVCYCHRLDSNKSADTTANGVMLWPRKSDICAIAYRRGPISTFNACGIRPHRWAAIELPVTDASGTEVHHLLPWSGAMGRTVVFGKRLANDWFSAFSLTAARDSFKPHAVVSVTYVRYRSDLADICSETGTCQLSSRNPISKLSPRWR